MCASASSSGSARTRNSTMPSPSSSRRPTRLDLGARLPVRRRHRDLHRRVLRGDLGRFGFGDMSQQERPSDLREDLRRHLGGHSADEQCQASARFGLDPVSAGAVRALEPREHRADGRCRGDRAFLHRLGHQACLESAIALANYLHSEPTHGEGVRQATRKSGGSKFCGCSRRRATRWNGSRTSSAIFDLDPVQFNYSLLTRSQRISHENLRLRDAEWLEGRALVPEQAGVRPTQAPVAAPMFAPFKLRDMELKNRIVVSPMAQYKAVDGCPTDWHLVHYGERAKGGAGPGLYRDDLRLAGRPDHAGLSGALCPAHEAAWKRIVDFVHARARPRSAARSVIPAPRDRPSSAGRAWTRRSRATGR
jgi:anthraniloyl-CoA monooxygenase